MLKNIDPLLTPELLYVLALMGHGDEIAVVDANFPAHSMARGTCYGSPVSLAGASAIEAVQAVLSLMPLDEFGGAPVRTMDAGLNGDDLALVQQEVQEAVDAVAGRHLPLDAMGRFAFYEASRNSYAIVLTSERRLYGNFLLRKGVVSLTC